MFLPLLPLLQASPGISFWSWSADPGVAIGVTVAAWYYYRRAGGRPEEGFEPISRARQISFGLGLATIVIALLSPLSRLADDYLLTAHMLQHLILTIIAPVLVLLGVPAWMYLPVTRLLGGRPWRVWRVLTLPVVAFALFHLPYVLYHIPVLYDLSLRNQPFHIAVHMFVVAGSFMAWWPVLAPGRELGQVPPAIGMIYLFLQTLPGLIVGAFITYAEGVIYPSYLDAARVFDISARTDQHLGGLIMWIGAALFYLSGVAIVFFRWASQEDQAHQKRYART